MNHATIQELKEYVQQKQIPFLIDDGLMKVKAGKTTLEEVLRVASLGD